MSDEKIKTSAAKPPLNLVPLETLVGPARVFGFGAAMYAPGNYRSATLDDGAGGRYVGAALRHLLAMQESNGIHTAASLAMPDDESLLPHIDHAICSLLMLRSILIKSGALAIDPGEGAAPRGKR